MPVTTVHGTLIHLADPNRLQRTICGARWATDTNTLPVTCKRCEPGCPPLPHTQETP